MGWLSFILMLFLMICYLLRPTRRFVPELFFLLSVAGLSFAFCLGSMIGHEDVWCSSDHENNSVGDPACTVQGISYVFFTLASACWWCLISFNIFLWAITGKNPDASPKKNGLIIAKDSDDGFDCHNIPRFWFYRAFYHALCWLFPLIIVIVLLASERLGFGGSDLYCTIHSNQHVTFTRGRTPINAHGAEEFDTWKLVIIVPILIMALMTACFTLVTFGIIAVRLAKMGTAYRTNKGFAKLLKQWRLLAFVILFFFIYLFVLIYEIEFSAIKNKQYKAYEDYFGCLALLEITSVNDTCELSREVSYGLWIFKTIIVCGQGVWVFFILGSVKDNYNRPLRLVRKFLLLVGLEHFCPTFASSLSEKSTSGSSADSSQRPSSSRRNKKHLPNVGGANVADLVENEKKIAFGMTMVGDTSSDSSSSSSYNSSDESSGYEDARPKRVRKSQQQQQAVSGDRNTQEEEEETGN
ncbi:G-protein coupled receptor Fz Smo [Balamuthia mandrillaris]